MHAGVERQRAVGRTIDQIVDVALHRTDMVLEARPALGEAREHEAAIFADARRSRQPECVLVEALAAALGYGDSGELAVGIERPSVIAACEPLGVAAPVVDHLGAAMSAAVEQHVNLAVAVPCHDDRLAAELGGYVVARIGHLTGVTDKQPSAAENAFHFQLKQTGIGVDAPVHASRLDQFGDVVGVSVAHPFGPLRRHGRA